MARIWQKDIKTGTEQSRPGLINLARIIRWYKGRVTYFARKQQASFAWQPRYHDTIIRDPESLERIRQYIINNPSKYHVRP